MHAMSKSPDPPMDEPSGADAPNSKPAQTLEPTTATQPESRPPVPETPAADPSSSTTPEKIKKRPSRVSLLGKRKNGSPSNSKRGRSTPNAANDSGTANAIKDPSTTSTPEKRKGGFLAFLNCCGRSQHDEDIDLGERNVPVEDSSRSQANQVDQLQKQDNSAAESSTAESKEAAPEKIGGPPYSDLKAAAEPKTQAPTTATESSTAQTATPTTITNTENKPTLETSKTVEEKPAVQAIVPPSTTTASPVDSGSPISATAVDSDDPKSEASDGETVMTDRTPQQVKRDSDVEMRDAPPIEPVPVPAAAEPSQDTEEKKEDPTPPLPPPPPLDQRRQETIRQADRNSQNVTGGGTETQKWLLPPMKPEFKGKKCLVLDLDETLVHSSFKVRSHLVGHVKFSNVA